MGRNNIPVHAFMPSAVHIIPLLRVYLYSFICCASFSSLSLSLLPILLCWFVFRLKEIDLFGGQVGEIVFLGK